MKPRRVRTWKKPPNKKREVFKMPICFRCRTADLHDIVPSLKGHFLRELVIRKGKDAGNKFQSSYDLEEGKSIKYCSNCYAYFKVIRGAHGLSYAEGPWMDLTEEVRKTEKAPQELGRIGLMLSVSLICGLAMVVMTIDSLCEWLGISVFVSVIITVIGTYGIPLPWYPFLHWVIEGEIPWGYLSLWAIGWGIVLIPILKQRDKN